MTCVDVSYSNYWGLRFSCNK